MNGKNEERIKNETMFMRAIDKPHLLIVAEKIEIKPGKTIDGLFMNLNEPNKLQYSLAEFGDEQGLQEYIDFFTKALERHRKIDRDEKAEVIHLNDKPDKRR